MRHHIFFWVHKAQRASRRDAQKAKPKDRKKNREQRQRYPITSAERMSEKPEGGFDHAMRVIGSLDQKFREGTANRKSYS